MNKIEIITPVHVGTGAKIEAPCFHRENEDDTIAKKYSFTDILCQMPPSILTNKNFLRDLANKQSDKKQLYQSINRYVDYSNLNEQYCVKDDNEDDISESGYDVFEQVKDLDKPYIPGSSIKGALINAWFYYLVKINLSKKEKLKEYIETNVLSSTNQKGNSIADQKTILNYLFNDSHDHSKFMKDLQSCLVCRDLYFDQIEVLWSERIGSGKNMDGSTIPLSYKECIQSKQIIRNEFMYIDEDKKDRLDLESYINEKLPNSEKERILNRYELILNTFKESIFYKACTAFTLDVLELDMTPKYQSLYHNMQYDTINIETKKLQNEIKQSLQTKEKVTYLRIGNSTNYFAKTITLLIKKYAPELYKKYFDKALSPNSYRNSKTRADKNSVPKTRVVYSSYEHAYLPGFIKIYYD